jgi:uncharacterized protein (TIGR03000 family)
MTAGSFPNPRGRSGGANPTSFRTMHDILRRFLPLAALLAALALPGGAAQAHWRRSAPLLQPAGAADASAKVEITVLVPADAEVFFDGEPTKQKGTERHFETPPLPVGVQYHYMVMARWKSGDKPIEFTRRVDVTAGAAVRVDFLAAPPPPTEKRAEIGKSIGQPGRLLSREGGPKNPWQVVGDKEPVFSGDLLIGINGNAIETKNGAVQLRLVKYFNSPLPVLEPGVTLHQTDDAAQCDLDFTLERGMVEVTNAKQKGSAHIRVRARDAVWDAILDEPGAQVLIEFYSGWPRGVRFTKNPGPKDVPLARMTFLVLKGDMDLKHSGKQLAMSAPPGQAVIEWDSVTGMDSSAARLEALPDWVLPPKDEAGKAFAKKYQEALQRFADEAVKTKSVDAVIDKFLASDDPVERRLAVVALAATDQLPRLGDVLKQSDQPDVWDNAVLALRHWCGRAPGQDQLLYQAVLDRKIFTQREAAAVMQLLHDFSDDDLARPVTYEMLINLLGSDKRFIRGLSYWHLSRLVPDGKKFGYDPFGPQEARDAAVKKWQEFIPEGKLPPHPNEDSK